MASCENCHTRGIKAEDIKVHEFPGGEKILIGPCCFGEQVRMVPQLDYHFEVSSKNGIVAQVEYGGLKVEYKKTNEELREKFTRPQVESQAAVH